MDISIIIPAYNRKSKLKACLDSLSGQDYAKNSFEIIVIDDGSSDGTGDMLVELSKTNPNLKYFIQAHKGPAAARNLGIKHAQGRIIGFTDSDCLLDRGWVKGMVTAHRAEQHIAAIGGETYVDRRNIKAMVSQSLSDGAINVRIKGEDNTIFFPTCNVSFKRDYLAKGFNELFPLPAGEDLDFFWRLFKKGDRFIHRQDIKVRHDCHTDFISFLRQAYMYGRGNYLVQHMHQDHPLLQEIKTANSAIFAFGLIVNLIKAPRFSFISGRRLIKFYAGLKPFQKFQVYVYFALHKIMYLAGNIAEHMRALKMSDLIRGEDTKETGLKPEYIILDITHRCNLRCNICEIRKDRKIEEYTLDEVKGIIDQAIEWGVKEFVLSGGEPLLREDIFDILDFVKARNYSVGILTNGIKLDETLIKRLLPYFAAKSLSLSISLDAMTPGLHDDIRGSRGCFEKTRGGLKSLSALKKSYPNINFNVISIILNENLEELIDLVNFLKSLNVNSIQLQPLLSNNLVMRERETGVKYWVPQNRLAVLDKVVDELIGFKRDNFSLLRNSEQNLNLVKKYFRGTLSSDDVKCHYITKTMLIANNGEVTTCFESYGNIRKNGLRKIFESKASQRARKRVAACAKPCLLPCFCD
ncbi:MAG: glycosyltransferase [Candidatus Omnitrophica bacterium]|nr:glycosyltransferase [Candidatus Omnitrophota bacterium]